MSRSQPDSPLLYLLTGIVAGGIAFLELGPFRGNGSSLLLTLVFWTAVVEGCIAVAAICDLVHARWIVTLKRELLSPAPLLFLLLFLFLILGLRLDLYSWSSHPGRWLNRPFFLIRNIIILLITLAAAIHYAARSRRNDGKTNTAAVLYLFAFVLAQSMVAYDWVMPLDDPWYSTLFGPYFFVEAIYCGIAVAGILYGIRFRGEVRHDGKAKEFLRDIATLTFGFSILWGGLFFTQFLVIWYGNLPEEVLYLVDRVSGTPWLALSCSVIGAFFVAPFFLLLPRQTKTAPAMVAFVSLIILGGLIIERILFLKPVLSLSTMIFLPEFLGMLLLFVLQMGRHRG
ncbi:MAG: hypothetical protein GXP58_07280 [Deltaproteobacteria bacterium]|nr:hypothetical protein [Deltaproteobacteria bacterium]